MKADIKPELLAAILKAIEEHGFTKSQCGKYLQKGKCPSCEKKELFTWADKPWVLRCSRTNKCGWTGHVKELYPDLFSDWTARAKERLATNPHAAAQDYLEQARGFDLDRIKGWYEQEHYYKADADNGKGAATATVRFKVLDGYWERLIDRPERFGKMKARFKPGWTYQGWWWCPPDLALAEHKGDLWITEGIFDTIALRHNGIASVAALSSVNYPEHALTELHQLLGTRADSVRLVFALDGDKSGTSYTVKHVRRARKDGWDATAAQIPQGRAKIDWNDLHQRERLEANHLADYLHHGALLVAESASEKALLIYNHGAQRAEFDFTFDRRLYWFKLDLEAYSRARRELADGNTGRLTDDDIREEALKQSHTIRPIASCVFNALYFQSNKITDEAWYYFRVQFPHDRPEVRGTFTAGQLAAAAEFKKRLLHLAPGALFEGSSQMLDRIMHRQLFDIQRVETIDFTGYSKDHGAWVLGDVAIKGGRVYEINDQDYFEIGKLALKSLQPSTGFALNSNLRDYTSEWVALLWECFGVKGLACLAFWLGSLFAEQIRATQKSYPFLEVVGEAGAGKSTLIEFLWKLVGRRDYEGFDPSKASLAARARNFAQVGNLPVVLIESDRERTTSEKTHVKSFDWDECKTLYNGRSVRARGMATGGNETYEPPFRGALVISQNNAVAASDAIQQRIVHLTFDRSRQTPRTRELAARLENLQVEQVSGFTLLATQAEGQILKVIADRTPIHEMALQAKTDLKSVRIIKNHAQLLALADALTKVVNLTDEQKQALQSQIETMAVERQRAISADHPLVQEFWEAFDYLEGLGQVDTRGQRVYRPMLDHSRDPDLIAVNLNEFIERATNHRQQVPALSDLKKVLRTSKSRPFVEVKTVNSAIRTKQEHDDDVGTDITTGTSVHCWVFRKKPLPPTTKS